MWNALAGYGGLVSVGQQAFIGIGAYGIVWLSCSHGSTRTSRWCRDALRRRSSRSRLASSCCGCAAAPVRDRRCGSSPRSFAILVSLDPSLGGGTGTSLIALQPPLHARRSGCAYTYWLALGAAAVFLVVAVPAAAQPARRVAAGDPRRRGGGRVARRARARSASASCSCSRRVGCGGGGGGDPREQLSISSLEPDSIFGVQLDGLHDLHGARRRPRHVRGADPRCDRALPDPDVRLVGGHLVPGRAGRDRDRRSRCSCRAGSGGRCRSASTCGCCPSATA